MTDFLSQLSVQSDDDGVRVRVGDEHSNVNGGVHGGLIATLIDTAMGQAVRAGLEEDQKTVTVQLTVTYLSPAEPGQEVRAYAEIRKRGGDLVLVEADVEADGTPVAHGVATFKVLG